jgi:hypothetical protein
MIPPGEKTSAVAVGPRCAGALRPGDRLGARAVGDRVCDGGDCVPLAQRVQQDGAAPLEHRPSLRTELA